LSNGLRAKPYAFLCYLDIQFINPFDRIFLILRWVGDGTEVVRTLLPELPEGGTLDIPSLLPYTTFAESLFLLR